MGESHELREAPGGPCLSYDVRGDIKHISAVPLLCVVNTKTYLSHAVSST